METVKELFQKLPSDVRSWITAVALLLLTSMMLVVMTTIGMT